MRRTAILFIAALLLVPCLAQADIAEIMSYQGVLRDASGSPVADGSYDVSFRIYDVETGGTALWTELQALTATGGIINAHLGSVVTLTTLEFDVPYWLGIAIAHQAELVPRTAFTTVPYAAHAGHADTCLEGDEDWQINGDDIHHDVGNVGIGTATPGVRLDVVTGDARCARFENSSGSNRFTVQGVNYGGTAGAFFAGTTPTSSPITPAAVYGKGGPGSRGAHFSSDGSDALFAYSAGAIALWGRSTSNYAGYFDGGGLGVYIEDQLETNGFRMPLGAADSYVLTSDVDGIGSWQPAAGGADGDWTITGSDMYSAVSGRVGVGVTAPAGKLGVHSDLNEQALAVSSGGTVVARMVNLERTVLPTSGSDILQMTVPSDSPDDFQFIEADVGGVYRFVVDGDGRVTAHGGGKFGDSVVVNSTLDVNGTSATPARFFTTTATGLTRVVSGVVTGTANADAVGVWGQSIPASGYGIGGLFEGGWRGVVGEVNTSGSSSYRGVYGKASGGIGHNYGVFGLAEDGYVNYGVYGEALGGDYNYAGWFVGDAFVTGTFWAGTKAFKIDHPLDPENKYLVHSCVESDDMMNIYNGNVTLDGRGEATVEMPDWFEALNQDFRYQLTPIGAPGPNLYVAEEIEGNRFRISGGEPGMKVSWLVTGVRHDALAVASRMVVEQDKPAHEVGKYMHPEAHGKPVTMGVNYHEERELPSGTTSVERATRPVRDRSDGD